MSTYAAASHCTIADIEAQKVLPSLLLVWENLCYNVKGKEILSNVNGRVRSGEMLAIMGPSGAGKSTLLDILAQRTRLSHGKISINDNENINMSDIASYVEQSDALLGILTVQETIRFAAQLSLDPSTPAAIVNERVSSTISGLGLDDVIDNRIGNAIQRGISGGQKRRVTIGTSLVTQPKILILDEPTSGLDSRTGREVLKAIKNIAIQQGMIVIASIHQPNWETIKLFDNLLLLAQGKTMYFGLVNGLARYLNEGIGHHVEPHANPCDLAIDLANTDFITNPDQRRNHVERLASRWRELSDAYTHIDDDDRVHNDFPRQFLSFTSEESLHVTLKHSALACFTKNIHRTRILIIRNTINYSRNLLAYGVRLGMYFGMGILLATVWVNLAQTSFKINDRLSVHFFSVAFLGFMSVAGIPAFLEERQVFMRERSNGLYGPGVYVIANSLCTIPYLFVCVVVFTILCYWSIGLHPGANAFFRFLAVIFLAVYAAESQSAAIAAFIPIFVAALAVACFLNGFWMCVQGYFIKAVDLPRFWYYWAHFIDYQTYAFDLLITNDLQGLIFDCSYDADGTCNCSYPSSLISQGICKLRGEDVLTALDLNGINTGLYAGILIIITVFYRILLYVILVFKRR